MSTFYFYRFVTTDPPQPNQRFSGKYNSDESIENRNYHPYLGKRNNNIIYFYEVTTTGMFNFTKTPMKSEQTGHSN